MINEPPNPTETRAFREWLSSVWYQIRNLSDGKGNTILGRSALPITATDGFVYVPTVAGTPTGVPSVMTGYRPICIDPSGGAGTGKLWVHNGTAWKGVNLT